MSGERKELTALKEQNARFAEVVRAALDWNNSPEECSGDLERSLLLLTTEDMKMLEVE